MNKTTTPKRQKTFFKSSELAHVWAHRGAPEGRRPSHERFSGDFYYSYSTPIAALVTGKCGVQGVIINATSYSVTTSGHQGSVRHATSHIENRFSIDGIPYHGNIPTDGKSLVSFYIERFNEDQGKPSKYAHKRAAAFLDKVQFLDDAIRASAFFGIAHKKLTAKRAKLQPEVEAASKIYEDKKAKLEEARSKRWATRRAKEDAQQQRRVEQAVALAKKFLADECTEDELKFIASNDAAFGWNEAYLTDHLPLKTSVVERRAKLREDIRSKTVADWIAGDPLASPAYNWPVSLRRDGDDIETTKGARVPVEHARRAFVVIQSCRDAGRKYIRTIHCHPQRVGHYAIDSIDENGNVVIGCHEISFEQIHRLAKSEGWIESPSE